VADLWATLLPLAIASAIVPVQLVITLVLQGSAGGRAVSLAWVLGMLTVRLGQGIVIGLLIGPEILGGEDGPGTAGSLLLLVVAILLLVMAARKAVDDPGEDPPPPAWRTSLENATPARAYLLGVGMLLIGAKFWVFTIGAISAIDAADPGVPAAVVAYLLFVLVAMSIHLAIVAMAYLAPDRAGDVLDRFASALKRYDRPITIAVGVIFGLWFLLKALDGLGVF
jgi:threonine/homoserine/homoserine lactone efflux protein